MVYFVVCVCCVCVCVCGVLCGLCVCMVCFYVCVCVCVCVVFAEPQCLYSTAITLLHLWTVRTAQSLSACTVQLYLYFSYGPYGLYRASVPVQYSYNSTPPIGRTASTEPQCLYSRAIPLLPLWAVRPVQYLSACTVQLYLYSPYGPYGLYSTSVPVQYSYTSYPPIYLTACTEPQCLYSTAIPLLPSVPVQYSYTSTPLSACTVQLYLYSPQCLHSTAIPLLPLWAVRPVQSLTACTRVPFTFTLVVSFPC